MTGQRLLLQEVKAFDLDFYFPSLCSSDLFCPGCYRKSVCRKIYHSAVIASLFRLQLDLTGVVHRKTGIFSTVVNRRIGHDIDLISGILLQSDLNIFPLVKHVVHYDQKLIGFILFQHQLSFSQQKLSGKYAVLKRADDLCFIFFIRRL